MGLNLKRAGFVKKGVSKFLWLMVKCSGSQLDVAKKCINI